MSGGGQQPHAKGALTRHAMPSLAAMMAGKTASGTNPTPSHQGFRKAMGEVSAAQTARKARPARKAR